MTLRAPFVLGLALAAGHVRPLRGQAPEPVPPPPAGTVPEPIRSLGQPGPWKPYLTLGLGYARESGEDLGLAGGALGTYRDLFPSLGGRLGWQAEAYGGTVGSDLDGGGRLMLRSPFYLLGGGLDFNARLGQFRGIASLQFPPVRGGLFGRGAEIRLDWLAGEAQAVQLGVQLPIGEPRAGRTRPRREAVRLPRSARTAPGEPVPDGSALARELERMSDAARWVFRFSEVFGELGGAGSGAVDLGAIEAAVVRLRSDLLERDPARPGRPPYERELLAYHAALERAFGLAGGTPDSTAQAAGAATARAARTIVLEEVIFPYDAAIGRYKEPDTLEGLVARARARFAGWLAGQPGETRAALATFDAWMEAVRQHWRGIGQGGGSTRSWLPLGLVLRPEEHRTQAQVDELLARATGEEMTGGNAVLYLQAGQFQLALSRTIQDAEDYHLLWMDAFQGTDRSGQPDRIGFYQSALGYLSALTRRVREYDRTGRLPAYILLLDMEGWEQGASRLWLDLLERPLDHRMELPPRYGAMAEVIAAWQDSLRQAVAASRRLDGEAEAFGPGWVRDRVKVHVNVLNPADFSFRSRRLPGFPAGADNQMRDRRRLVLRDVTEANPAAGEMLVSGVAVGDRFTAPSWEDRILLVTGPAAAAAKREARAALLGNGLGETDLPAPLREATRIPDFGPMVGLLEAAGSTARILQAHNATGWGEKEASFAQLLLWDLAPPGTVIYVADDRWTDPLWVTRLLAAAVRGCEVFLVAPSLANAPAEARPAMPATRHLFTRLAVVGQELGDILRHGGGDLHVGLYTRRAPVGIPSAKLWEVDTTYGKYAFLRAQFPFPEATSHMLWEHRGRMDSARPAVETPPADRREAVPRLHRRVQFLGSRELLDRLARRPEVHDALDLTMQEWSEGVTSSPERGPIPAQRRFGVAGRVMAGFDELPAALQDTTLLYLILGTTAKDTASLVQDGGAVTVVSGRWSLSAWLDFWALFGSTTWIERVEEVDELIPPRD